jgi:hypothetical protein
MKFSRYALPALASVLTLAATNAYAAEGTFDKTIRVNGHITLHIACDNGEVHIVAGPANEVRVYGKVTDLHPWGQKLSYRDDRMHQIAGNPPVHQLGNTVTIGNMMENQYNVKIDYEIEAPADANLDVFSGSGDIEDEGVGVDVHLNTHSGNISATGLKTGYSIQTGSGNIVADGGGAGDVKIHTSTGSIELHALSGGLKLVSGTGDVKIDGRPSTKWEITVDSGSVEYWPNRAPMDLEASTVAGSIHVDGTTETVRTDQDRHSLNAKLQGGGPPVHIETASGEIRVH